MRKLLLKLRLFKRNKKHSSLFSLALKEAFKDTFKEMGYHFDKDIEKKENDKCP